MAAKKKRSTVKNVKNIKKKSKLKKVNKNKRKAATKKTNSKTSKKVMPVPKGYHNVTAYLIVNNAAKAIDFYKAAFGAKEVMRMAKPDGKVGHAEIRIGDSKIMLGDECPEMDVHSPETYGGSAVGIHLYMKNVDQIVEKAIGLGARLIRPAQDMFYGDRSAAVTDPFGHRWFVSTHIEDVTPAKIRKRAAELYSRVKEIS